MDESDDELETSKEVTTDECAPAAADTVIGVGSTGDAPQPVVPMDTTAAVAVSESGDPTDDPKSLEEVNAKFVGVMKE